MRTFRRKWLVMLLAAIMVASLGAFMAGCSSDDKDDNGPTGPGGGGGGTSGSACDQLCARVCNMEIQCGGLPAGSCTNQVISQCGDQLEAQAGNAACQQGLNAPLNCSML